MDKIIVEEDGNKRILYRNVIYLFIEREYAENKMGEMHFGICYKMINGIRTECYKIKIGITKSYREEKRKSENENWMKMDDDKELKEQCKNAREIEKETLEFLFPYIVNGEEFIIIPKDMLVEVKRRMQSKMIKYKPGEYEYMDIETNEVKEININSIRMRSNLVGKNTALSECNVRVNAEKHFLYRNKMAEQLNKDRINKDKKNYTDKQILTMKINTDFLESCMYVFNAKHVEIKKWLEDEIWAPAVWYDPDIGKMDEWFYMHYEVSNKGRLRDKKTKRLCALNVRSILTGPYLRYSFYHPIKKFRTAYDIHRIVMFTFGEYKSKNPWIYGVYWDDENPFNNEISNLKLISRTEKKMLKAGQSYLFKCEY